MATIPLFPIRQVFQFLDDMMTKINLKYKMLPVFVSLCAFACAYSKECAKDTVSDNIHLIINIQEEFDLKSLSENRPFILLVGGHQAFPWVMVVDNISNYTIYSGSLNNKGNYISKESIFKNIEIINWAFDAMSCRCGMDVLRPSEGNNMILTTLIYVDSNGKTVFSYDNNMKFTDEKCQDNINELIGYLMSRYIFKL